MSDQEHLGGCKFNGDPHTYMPDIWQELLDTYLIKSVLDIGCGAGKNLEWFIDKVQIIQGVEGWHEAVKICTVPVIEHDYTKGPLSLVRNYDLCICTEFVEHVDQQYENNWFATIQSAKHVLMCHGLPGQGGWHHVNCQDSEYWINRFKENNYTLDRNLSEKFRDTGRNAPWGRNTLMFFTKYD